jgi:predicted DNA-binding transcriptional regulator AlpA
MDTIDGQVTGRKMPGRMDRKASSIDEFCLAHGISRAMFYKLLKQGLAPRLMTVGTRRLVSDEAAADWRRQMEAA